VSVVVLLSGRGSNLQAALDAGIAVSAVISNVAGAGGLEIAAKRGIPALTVPHRDYPTREAFEDALAAQIDRYAPKLIVHAGFMRIVTPGFVARYPGRMLNIHPSLLPSFPGLDPHGQALKAGVKISGATVHFVIPETDAGPIVMQGAVPVCDDDTADTLSARILTVEHRIYPEALRLLASGRLKLEGDLCKIDGGAQNGAPLISPLAQ
jgi:phosphoribosylglycinamide formyltransferase 1